MAVARAKSFVCAAAVDVVGTAMQLHGGIGYTWESGIHDYLKRAVLNRSLFGSPVAHRRRLFASIADALRSEQSLTSVARIPPSTGRCRVWMKLSMMGVD